MTSINAPEEYFKELGLDENNWTTDYKTLLKIATELCSGEEVTAVFINDMIDEGGNRSCHSMWFMSDKYSVEARNFQDEYKLDVIANRVRRIEVSVVDFDLEKVVDSSSLTVHVGYEEQTWGDFYAARENCLNLWNIVRKYYIPRI